MEIYARRQDNLNRRTFKANHARTRKAGTDPFLAEYRLREIPKVIWMYWGQGAENAPHVVGRCIESWKRQNPGWEVRVLDENTVSTYADLSDLPDFLPRRFAADLLRLRLLKAHGGVWTDATVFCHKPLDDWLPLMAASGFFCLVNPGQDRWFSSWFLASQQDHDLVSSWEDAFGSYLRSSLRKPDMYFMFFYTFQWRLRSNAKAHSKARAAWARQSGLAAPYTFLLMAAIKGFVPVSQAKDMITAGLPVSKLSWKEPITPEQFDDYLAQFSSDSAIVSPE
jgi:hypothetical protein